MRRPRQAPEPVARPVPGSAAVPTAYELATPEQRAAADAIIRALVQDLAACLLRAAEESRRAARL